MTSLQLQQAIAQTLQYMEYWSTINSILIFLFALSAIGTFLCGINAGIESERDDGTAKDRLKAASLAYTAAIITLCILASLIFTPSSDAEASKLPMYASQLNLTDPQNCSFLRSLDEKNKTFGRNVVLPKECIPPSRD